MYKMKKVILAAVMAVAIAVALLPAADFVSAETAYNVQPETALVQGSEGNGVALIDPDTQAILSGVTVLKEHEIDDTGYSNDYIYLNQLDETVDASLTDMITITWKMTSGMNNFNINKLLYDDTNTGLPKNIDYIKVYTADMSKVVAEYDEGCGALHYLGALGSSEVNNQGTMATKGIKIGIDTSVFSNGQYILQFASGLRGNNDAKTIKYNGSPCHIRFLINVKATPDLPDMISEAENYLKAAQDSQLIGDQPGQYPSTAAETLQAAIDNAKARQAEIEASESTESEKHNLFNEESLILFNALEDFKAARYLNISIDAINGIGSSQTVGDTAIASAEVSAENITGDDLTKYQKVTWSSDSDCISINSTSGKWYAKFAGTAKITATSVSQPGRSKTITVKVANPEDVDLAVCKSVKEINVETLVSEALAGSGKSVTDIKRFRVITLSGIELASGSSDGDLSYIASKMKGLEYLDLKNASLASNELVTGAFQNCTWLKEVVLPYNLEKIGHGAFNGCTGLEKISIPANVSSIGGGAFAGCSSLENTMYCYSALPPTYTSSNASWGDSFKGLNGTNNVTFLYVPAGCKQDYQAATGWRNFRIREMEEVKLDINFTETKGLEAAAVKACQDAGLDQAEVTSLKITSPEGAYMEKTTDISYLQKHFLGVQYLDMTGTHFDNENIQSNVFGSRKNMKEIYLSENITHIGKSAFENCLNLRTFTVPAGIASRQGDAIGASCFANCPKLKTMIINCTTPPGVDGGLPTSLEEIYVPTSCIDLYKTDGVTFEAKASIIKPQVTVGVSEEDAEITVEVYQPTQLQAQVYSVLKKDCKLKWEIKTIDNLNDGDIEAATVTEDGIVTGMKYGSTIVRVTAEPGSPNECYATCKINVKKPQAVVLSASQKAYNSNQLTWTPSRNAEAYQVWRATSETGSYSKLAGGDLSASTLTFEDTSASEGKTYWYKVRWYKIVNGTTVYGEFSNVANVTTILRKPGSLTLTASQKSYTTNRLTWTASKYAQNYQVYRATSKDGSYTKLTSLPSSSLTYDDTKAVEGKSYWYKVRGIRVVNSTTINGPLSTPVKVTTFVRIPPKVTSVKAVNKSVRKVVLTWGSAKYAAKYRVYRSTSKTSGYKLVKTTTSRTFTDSSLTKGKTYYYKVRAVTSIGKVGSLSTVVGVKIVR